MSAMGGAGDERRSKVEAVIDSWILSGTTVDVLEFLPGRESANPPMI